MARKATINDYEFDLDVDSGANWNLTKKEKIKIINKIIELGRPLTVDEMIALNVLDASGNKSGTARMDNVMQAQATLLENNQANFTALGIDYKNAMQEAEEIYYNETGKNYPGASPTTGEAIYNAETVINTDKETVINTDKETETPEFGWKKVGNKWVYYDNDGKIIKETADEPTTGLQGDDYITNNMFKTGQIEHVKRAIEYFLTNGKYPDKDTLGVSENAYENIIKDLDLFLSNSGIDPVEYQNNFLNSEQDAAQGNALLEDSDRIIDPQEAAKNAYYNDLYSLKPGTEGKLMLDTLEQSYKKQANNDKILAEVAYQRGALNQAKTVKQIADQVRAERMARLRSGMSEAQLANQDMQLLIANMNSLNENTAALNEARLGAGLNENMAKDQAYLAYLDQANARGQNAAAMYAADSGNSY